jgi:Phosphotransferase enzyme family
MDKNDTVEQISIVLDMLGISRRSLQRQILENGRAPIRFKQIALKMVSLSSRLPNRHYIALSGPGLHKGRGRVRIHFNAPVELAKTKWHKQTLICFGGFDAKRADQSFWSSIGLDQSDSIECVLSDIDAVIFVGSRKGVLAVSHFGWGKIGMNAVSRHHEGLKSAQHALGGNAAQFCPGILTMSQSTHKSLLVQTCLDGMTANEFSSTDEKFVLMLRTATLFRGTQFANQPTSKKAEEKFINETLRELVERLPLRHKGLVSKIISELMKWYTSAQIPGEHIHGDYWLNNIMVNRESGQIIGLIDWEWASAVGFPLQDELHLFFMSTAMRTKTHIGLLLPEIWKKPGEVRVDIGEIRNSAHERGLSESDLAYIAIVLWLKYLWQGHVLTYSGGDAWLDKMIEAPAMAILEWTARCEGRLSRG